MLHPAYNRSLICDVLNACSHGNAYWYYRAASAQQLEDCFRSIKAAADASPVLLIIENIHAAGRQTLELLARLISAVGEAPVLLLMTSAYGGENREKVWQDAMLYAPLTTIDLP